MVEDRSGGLAEGVSGGWINDGTPSTGLVENENEGLVEAVSGGWVEDEGEGLVEDRS